MGPWDIFGGGGPSFSQYANPFGSLSPSVPMALGSPGGGASGGVGMPLNIMPPAAQTVPSGVGQIGSANMGMPNPGGPSQGMNSNLMAQLGLNMLRPQQPLQSVAPQMQFYQPRPTGMLGY